MVDLEPTVVDEVMCNFYSDTIMSETVPGQNWNLSPALSSESVDHWEGGITS